MRKIENFEQMENNSYYSYGKELNKRNVFRFKKEKKWDKVTLHYKSGYVSNPPDENFKRHINEGKVYKVPSWKAKQL